MPPKGVTQPPRSPIVPPAKFGFVENAERLNSRAAMVRFLSSMILYCSYCFDVSLVLIE